MKNLLIHLFSICMLGSLSFFSEAQTKAKTGKELEQFLPKTTPAGFTREKPSASSVSYGSDESTISMGSASVRYKKGEVEINVAIIDYLIGKEALQALCLAIQMNMNIETETNITRVKPYKNTKLVESINKTESGDPEGATLIVCHKDRFYIVVESYQTTDLSLLYNFLDAVDLNGL
jgi:hypothetical protein